MRGPGCFLFILLFFLLGFFDILGGGEELMVYIGITVVAILLVFLPNFRRTQQ